jgi:hypothetical protein
MQWGEPLGLKGYVSVTCPSSSTKRIGARLSPERAESYFVRFLELAPESEKAAQVASWLESREESK